MALKSGSLLRQSTFRLADNSRASILIIALWSICLLATFSVVLGYQVRQKLTLVNRLDEKDRLYFTAEAAIKRAAVELKKEPEKACDALKDTWSNNISAFKEIDIGDGKFSILYAYIDEQSGIQKTQYGLIDEERKININKANRPVLERFFRIVLDFDEINAQELAASVIDWRDSDSQLSIPLGSAEDPDYRSLQYPYEAKDAEFEVLDEVLLVKGMTQDIFEKIKDYITIYGSGKVNINTASKPVLLALGLDDDIADKILSFRAGEDGIIATSDDNIFDTASNIIPKLSQSCHLSDSEVAKLSVVADQYLITNSNNFMVKVVAKLNNRKNTAELICVVNRSGKVLYWQEF